MEKPFDAESATTQDRALLLWLHAMSLLTTRYLQLTTRFLAARRRRRQMLLDHTALALARNGSHLAAHLHNQNYFGRRRQIWRKDRPSTFWEDRVQKHFTPADWIEHFRMSAKSFAILCDLVEPYIQPKDNPVMAVVPTDKRVAMVIYKLANCSMKYREVAELFAVHRCTLAGYVFRFCEAINKMQDSFIRLPNADEAFEISERIQLKSDLPQFYGVVGSTHIPIALPRQSASDFKTTGGWASYILQAVVDDQCLFRNIDCSVPGSASNAEALEEMQIFQNRELLPQKSQVVCAYEIPLLLAADRSYPSTPWLLTEHGMASHLKARLNSIADLAEDTFTRLKGRWNILCRPLEVAPERTSSIVATCCCLHNFCEIHGEPYSSNWGSYLNEFVSPRSYPVECVADLRDLPTVEGYIAALTSHIDGYQVTCLK